MGQVFESLLIGRVAGLLRLSAFWLCFAVAAYAVYDAFQPPPLRPKPPPFQYYDKVIHIGAYFALATLLSQGLSFFRSSRRWLKRWRNVAIVWGGVTLFGAGCELVQFLMKQGRIGDPYDVMANGIGAILACLLFRWLQSVEDAIRARHAAATRVETEIS